MYLTSSIEKEVLENLKNGDPNAFESVFKFWYEPLVHFADEYISDLESARNIVQNIFMRLWEKHTLVDPDSNLKAYLYMATRNACLSHMRHLRVETAYFEKSLHNNDNLQLNYDALEELNIDQIDFSQLEKLIRETIESLPERCREVFIMSRYQEMKNKEIALKLDITVKAVEANITRALTKLRENTKDYLPELVFFLLFNTRF
ncbi:MAG: RNA polymerase sigma-70 factor [Prolixibacteraceae bacterium]|nr:RNA polymerase sigma-70 factor [Prolixibacteraceae bacterium]